jgi:hypothetical protein
LRADAGTTRLAQTLPAVLDGIKAAGAVPVRLCRLPDAPFTHLTNAFSKQLADHAVMVSLYVRHYHFARVHQTLRVTPAIRAGLADHVWSIPEIVARLDRP